jgi:hypothetical protein
MLTFYDWTDETSVSLSHVMIGSYTCEGPEKATRGGLNESQSKLLTVTWHISQTSKSDTPSALRKTDKSSALDRMDKLSPLGKPDKFSTLVKTDEFSSLVKTDKTDKQIRTSSQP